MTKKTIHIASVADNNYVQHLGVMYQSLLMNIPHDKCVRFHLLHKDINKENIVKLSELVTSKNGEIQFYKIDTQIYENVFTSNHITEAAYYRISIPDILEESIEKVIYLDCDLVIKNDISLLWDVELTDYSIGAVGNLGGYKRFNDLDIPSQYKYFNSGVLILNLKKWRKNKTAQLVLSYMERKKGQLVYHDQDALNGVLYNDWLELHPKWNMQYNMYFKSQDNHTFVADQLSSAVKTPYIIHYTGSCKPWDYHDTHPLGKEYYKYIYETDWKDFRPQFTMKRGFKKVMKIMLPIKTRYYLMSKFKNKN
ncbi:glycosyltransferase family 8 protein [Bacillus luti]|uniref:Glycosyltransferase family 8 protein n=1 Tax=Bacillus luti TaxID=2026191 RepID=A0ABU8HSX4_9BACI|nr:glycosyltransferase family 8 protein [Bacillus luti]